MPGFVSLIVHFVPVIFVVILVHELGHFVAAKAVGIRVDRFSIGFPPRLIGKKYGDTDYCISALPLGGYVKMAGMIDESLDTKEADKGITGAPWEFQSKPTWAKILVVCAGVIMNFVLAFVLFTVVTGMRGIGVEAPDPIIGQLQPEFPAQEAGLEPGDRIVEADGRPMNSWEDLVEVIHARPEQPTHLVVERGTETFEVDVTPQLGPALEEGGDRVGLIGIFPQLVYRKASFGESISEGWLMTANSTRLVVSTLGRLVTGGVSVKDLSGPVGIAKMAVESAKGGMLDLLFFVALISINIGFLNILPIPALDGGHLAMVLWEGSVRKPLSTRVKLAIQQVGMVFLLLLMAFIIYNDFTK